MSSSTSYTEGNDPSQRRRLIEPLIRRRITSGDVWRAEVLIAQQERTINPLSLTQTLILNPLFQVSIPIHSLYLALMNCSLLAKLKEFLRFRDRSALVIATGSDLFNPDTAIDAPRRTERPPLNSDTAVAPPAA